MVFAADLRLALPLIAFERPTRSEIEPRSETGLRAYDRDRLVVVELDSVDLERDALDDPDASRCLRVAGVATETTIGGTTAGAGGGVTELAAAESIPIRRRSTSIRFRRSSSRRLEAPPAAGERSFVGVAASPLLL